MTTNPPLIRPKGRPRRQPDELSLPFSLRLTPTELAKLERLGGRDWLRRSLARAKDRE